jgi:hypothetical protein
MHWPLTRHFPRRPTALHLFSGLLPFRRWAASWLAEQKTSENTNLAEACLTVSSPAIPWGRFL